MHCLGHPLAARHARASVGTAAAPLVHAARHRAAAAATSGSEGTAGRRVVCSAAPGEGPGPVDAGKGPAIRRRLALLGGAVPCLCGLCGGGATATAARNPLYDSYFANAMRYAMDDYEVAIRPTKEQLFDELVARLARPEAAAAAAGGAAADGAAVVAGGAASNPPSRLARVLEVGVGTGPNFPFYTAALAKLPAANAPGGGAADGQAQPALPASASASSSAAGADAGAGAGAAAPAVQLPAAAQSAPWRLQLVGLDPNPAMLEFAREAAQASSLGLARASGGSGGSSAEDALLADEPGVALVEGSAEALPFGDGVFDAAVVTLVLCSVPNPEAALRELRRVVRRGGSLLLVEHVRAGEGRPLVRWVQGFLTPLQRLMADGCNLNRDTAAAVRAAGWDTAPVQGAASGLRSFDLEGFSILAPHIAGVLAR